MSEALLEPWQWPEFHWRAVVERVRGGRPLRPGAWPGGARFAVALSFDSDHETNELRDGGGSIARLSWGEYGPRVGVPRLAALMARHDVRATFFVPAVAALLHPEEQKALVGAGHEIGLHGWIHELNTAVPAEAERDLMFRAADTLERITGARPVGLRTPSWDFSAATLSIEREMGLEYDSSLMADEDCYEIIADGEATGIIELPVEWIRDDAPYFSFNRVTAQRPFMPPKDVFDIWRRELEAASEAGGLFQLTCHPHIIGYRSRVWIIEALIEHAKALGGAWFGTHAQVAAWAREHG
jgi:peptidoglycan/xylan/chitin deacetylase (PgdA/CDA1 family)